jgi:hypothetical protein
MLNPGRIALGDSRSQAELLMQLGVHGYRDGGDVAGNTIDSNQVLFPKLQ